MESDTELLIEIRDILKRNAENVARHTELFAGEIERTKRKDAERDAQIRSLARLYRIGLVGAGLVIVALVAWLFSVF